MRDRLAIARRSPSSLGPGDAEWDQRYAFDDDAEWDALLRGRSVVVGKGQTVDVVASQFPRRKAVPNEDSVQRIVRLTLAAPLHTLIYTVESTLDTETIQHEVPVARGNVQSVTFACDHFKVQAQHPDPAGAVAGLATFRIDDKGNSASVWMNNRVVVGGGAEAVVAVPPYAHEFDVYTAAVAGCVLRYYSRDEIDAGALIYQETLANPRASGIRVNNRGIMTIQAAAATRHNFQFRCVG